MDCSSCTSPGQTAVPVSQPFMAYDNGTKLEVYLTPKASAVCGGWALGQLWLFWLAPVVGAALAWVTYHGLFAEGPQEPARAAERAR